MTETLAQAPVLTLVPDAPDPDRETCRLIAEMYLAEGYDPEQIGTFLAALGTSPSWKQRAAEAASKARVTDESVRLILAAGS